MGKNYFPSNIQGLPTWYEIRVTKDGHVARSGRVDIMVAMNAETYARDVKEVAPGGYLVYDSTWPRPALLKREDITVIGVPLARLCNENFNGVRTRILMKNICFAGVLAALLDLDVERIRELLAETYAKKPQLVDSNMKAIQLGYDYTRTEDGCHGWPHHDRWKYGRRVGLYLRRRNRCRLVSDHALDLVDGCLQGVL
jgi:2-oxoglutarate ferredoxin oxidoreductase subunit alpha